MDTQYHWYLVADMVLQAAEDGQLRFTLSGDKFKVGHKRPDKPWSYAYRKRQGPLHARKRFLVESLELLKSQQQELAQRMAADANVTEAHKEKSNGALSLLGCSEADAMSITKKVAELCDLGPINWSTTATKWKETKKTPERWWVEITGLLHAPSKELTPKQLAAFHNSHFLLVADQVASKLDANRYHTTMRGFKVPLGLGCVDPTMETTVRLCSHLQVVKEALLSNLIKQGPPLSCAAEQATQAKVDATHAKKVKGTPTIKNFLQQKKHSGSALDTPTPKKTKLSSQTNSLTFGATLPPSQQTIDADVTMKPLQVAQPTAQQEAKLEVHSADVHEEMALALLKHKLAEAAFAYDWSHVTSLVGAHPDMVNSVRPGGRAKFTPLHQAAYGGAPMDVIKTLIALGADKNAVDSQGQTPMQVAQANGNKALIPLLS